MSILNNCGLVALGKYLKAIKSPEEAEPSISTLSLVALGRDLGVSFKVARADTDLLDRFKEPAIICYDNHFEILSDKLPNDVPEEVVVITEFVPDGFEEVGFEELAGIVGAKGGGGGTTVVQSSPPPQPSTKDAITAWVESMPQVYETQLQYAPLQAQQEVDLANQYAFEYGQAMQKANEGLYPRTSEIQETIAGQALEGMAGAPPQWMQDQYRSDMAANLGTNVGSPIAADYMSRGMLAQQQDWQNYYRNLGLTAAGRQPLAGAQTPNTTNYMGGFTPQSNMNFMASTYGPFANASRNTTTTSSPNSGGFNWGGAVGAGLMGAGMMFSDASLKEDVEALDGSLEKISKLVGSEWQWKEDGTVDAGVIAQQVEEVIPEAVAEIDGIKLVKPMALIGHLIEAVKELKGKIEEGK